LRVEGEIVWRCDHLHRAREGAFACASRERARRQRETATTNTKLAQVKADEER
jgi:hypothetical protein